MKYFTRNIETGTGLPVILPEGQRIISVLVTNPLARGLYGLTVLVEEDSDVG
jgi:hypothetical protein